MIALEKTWCPSGEFLSESDKFKVDPKSAMKPCGCGVKIDLDNIVYPTLEQVKKISDGYLKNLGIRCDSFRIEGRFKKIHRRFFHPNNIEKFEREVTELLKNPDIALVVELFSSPYNQYREFTQLSDHFRKTQIIKHQAMKNILEDKRTGAPLHFAKGHSIQGGLDFFMLDFIEVEPVKGVFTYFNNDTIVTGDSVLHPHSPASIFIALNNALNDILLSGADKNVKLFPVYDGTEDAIVEFKKGFDLYKNYLAQRQIQVELIDQGPLNQGGHFVGATVLGESDYQSPQFSDLRAGDEIILTHHLGDLALLSQHRSSYFKEEDISESLKEKRESILQKMMSPHFYLCQIIKKFLPLTGETFDSNKHISFASDVSGPGLSVLEEAAMASGVDLLIEEFTLHSPEVLNYSRKNYTTSTNGPWLIAGKSEVMARVLSELQKAGVHEVQRVGRVMKTSASPCVHVKEELRRRYAGYKHDLFFPKIAVKTSEGEKLLECPLFKKVQFVED